MLDSRWARIAVCICATVSLSVAFGADKPKEDEEGSYIRVVRNDKGTPVSMETSIITLSNGKTGDEERTIDLVSAIHVGDRRYYTQLNDLFTQYDALLYELVAPEGSTPADRPTEGGKHPIAAMQDGLKELLALEHQLAIVDYEKDNFVHADMSPEDFEKAMKERGESFMTMFFRMAFEGMKQQSKKGYSEGEDLRMLMALMSPNRPLALKRILSDQFEQLESISAGLDGPTGSAIVTDRNKKALDVLTKTLDKGSKKVGIFYGAAHMADMEKRLINDFHFKRTSQKWLVAWDMKENKQTSEFMKKLEQNRKKRAKLQPAATP